MVCPHIVIHLLTGLKICKEPGCGQRFSQLGNLKVELYSRALSISKLIPNRPTSVAILANDLTAAPAATNLLHKREMFVLTKRRTSKPNHSSAAWMIVGSISHSWGT